MKHIAEINERIMLIFESCYLEHFDFYNEKERDEFHKLNTSINLINHTCKALIEFEDSKFDFRSNEGKYYLYLYGFFQSIHMQQDAIFELLKYFYGSKKGDGPWAKEDSWKRLRYGRNQIVGHPIEYKDKENDDKKRTLVAPSINGKFTMLLLVSNKEGVGRLDDMDIKNVYNEYKKSVTIHLRNVLLKIRKEWGDIFY